jgi:hypothetical protein
VRGQKFLGALARAAFFAEVIKPGSVETSFLNILSNGNPIL